MRASRSALDLMSKAPLLRRQFGLVIGAALVVAVKSARRLIVHRWGAYPSIVTATAYLPLLESNEIEKGALGVGADLLRYSGDGIDGRDRRVLNE